MNDCNITGNVKFGTGMSAGKIYVTHSIIGGQLYSCCASSGIYLHESNIDSLYIDTYDGDTLYLGENVVITNGIDSTGTYSESTWDGTLPTV